MNVQLMEKYCTDRRAPSPGAERRPLGMTAACLPRLCLWPSLSHLLRVIRVIFLKPRVSNCPLLKNPCRCTMQSEV